MPLGNHVLRNVGSDEPFGGGDPGGAPPDGFEPADPDSTGQLLQFRVVPAAGPDPNTPPAFLQLPALPSLPAQVRSCPLALIEKAGVGTDATGGDVEGPVEAVLGTAESGVLVERLWMDPPSETPGIGDTEVWELFNTTADAHPMHIHEVAFQVVNRQALAVDDGEVLLPLRLDGDPAPPEAWETGVKDTVVAYPGQVTRVRAQFTTPGQYVWHCHIVEHEDNEMMRPYRVGPPQPGQPGS